MCTQHRWKGNHGSRFKAREEAAHKEATAEMLLTGTGLWVQLDAHDV